MRLSRRFNPQYSFGWILFFTAFFIFASPASAAHLQKVTFLPQWFPQAQFAGYYTAKEKGIYEKYGLDVTILRGGPEMPSDTMLSGRKTMFATMFLAEAVQQSSKGPRLVNIAQIVQRSGFMIVAKKSSGIQNAGDLQGKRVSLWPNFSLQPLAFFRKQNIKVKIIPQAYTLNLFLRGGVDAASAMWYNEYHSIMSAGVNEDELTTFFFNGNDFNFPEDGIYCLEETWKKNPDLVRRFARASIEGWNYAFAHPEEALNIVMKYVEEARINTSRPHQKWMLGRIKEIIVPADRGTSIGTLSEKDYMTVARELRLRGLISRIPPYEEFYAGSSGKK